LRRRQRQAEYQQRFASEWLEESRVIEESLRFREEEVIYIIFTLFLRRTLRFDLTNLNILAGINFFAVRNYKDDYSRNKITITTMYMMILVLLLPNRTQLSKKV
jgi:hypothetical protein